MGAACLSAVESREWGMDEDSGTWLPGTNMLGSIRRRDHTGSFPAVGMSAVCKDADLVVGNEGEVWLS